MRYAGSKKSLLLKDLGEVISSELGASKQFWDLFSGTGTVSHFVSQKYDIKTHSSDLQLYSKILTSAITTRTKKINFQKYWNEWQERVSIEVEAIAESIPSVTTRSDVLRARNWCSDKTNLIVTKSYGGYYFSPMQGVVIDSLLKNMPSASEVSLAAHAALIKACSECSSSPGHTAQPFQPTETGFKHLHSFWKRDVVERVRSNFESICETHACRIGEFHLSDANLLVSQIQKGDLVFLDPPYSDFQYSRFYHVLETIAKKKCSSVSGIGRYPDISERPKSNYSLKAKSKHALDDLLTGLHKKRAKVILTFPKNRCSNGLSGEDVVSNYKSHFKMDVIQCNSAFSTLGGNSNGGTRASRIDSNELIIVMKPR